MLQDYIFLHGIPYSNQVYHASCFKNHDFKMFGDSNHIKVKFCTVGDHRSDGLVEKIVLSVTFRLLAVVQDFQNYTLQDARLEP